MSYFIGDQLWSNMMNGRPTRMKSHSDYEGVSIPPCGDFEELESRRTIPPWLNDRNRTSVGRNPLSLHNEIKLFMEYMTPSPQEIVTRRDLVKRFTALVESLMPSATVIPVGSHVTGLYLPTSDIDMVLKLQQRSGYYSGGSTLRALYYKISRSGFASKIDDILHASVPLIRITDKQTGIEIDLTASDTHSVQATEAVEKWLKYDTDIARMLIFVIKIFLAVRRCGTTYTGGVNSYVLVWMVVAWVRLEWPKLKGRPTAITTSKADASLLAERFETLFLSYDARESVPSGALNNPVPRAQNDYCNDFGEALKGFLKFYGTEFDYQNREIWIEPNPRYASKLSVYTTQRFLLSIFDPANTSIDMGKKAYGIKHVRASFQKAYQDLALRTKSDIGPKGLLGTMIGGDFTKYIQKRNNLKVGKSIAAAS